MGRKEGGRTDADGLIDQASKRASERASDDPVAAAANELARAVIQIDDNKFPVRFGAFLQNVQIAK